MAKRWGWVVTGLLILALVAVPTILIVTELLQTDFGKHTTPAPEAESVITLADLWELLVIPLVLAGIVAWFSWFAKQKARQAETGPEPTPVDTEAGEAGLQPQQLGSGVQGDAIPPDNTVRE
jgi:heme/copper-type cytochrome/quinol oxidase subunit 2